MAKKGAGKSFFDTFSFRDCQKVFQKNALGGVFGGNTATLDGENGSSHIGNSNGPTQS